MKLLFVTNLDPSSRQIYGSKWRSEMKLLFVSKLDRSARAVVPITKYVEAGNALGHEVAVFGERRSEFPSIPFSLDVKAFDAAIFVIYLPSDFPDLPYLARLLDEMPKERRIIIDCAARYNDTIRIDHDFNHLEKLDGHQGWEWVEGFQAVSDRMLQPTLTPLRPDVRPFLFHGYDPRSVARPFTSPREAASAWLNAGTGADGKPYGLVYVGNNWQRWTQVGPFLQAIEPLNGQLGPICLVGWDWDKRPDWAVEHGLQGVDVDVDLLRRMSVETREPIAFNEVVDFTSKGRFCPIFHRPLFTHLGLVTNRTFETFCSDTMPLLMLPNEQVDAIYGPEARILAPGDDVRGRVEDMLSQPEPYWEAVLKTRAYLAEHHSYTRRLEQLTAIVEG
jgi:hypothetical protein